jgi:hypothetical protein
VALIDVGNKKELQQVIGMDVLDPFSSVLK